MANLNDDIRNAQTLNTDFYTNSILFEQSKDLIFTKTWQFGIEMTELQLPDKVVPFNILEGFLNEPILFTRDSSDKISVLSNVCTHRGNILVSYPQNGKKIRCGYHGRTFSLDGKMLYMPEFKEALNFPSKTDNLPNVDFRIWKDKFSFVSIKPEYDFDEVLNIMNKKIGFLPINEFLYSPERSKDYLVNAHWALYCENYLEGFHIPFVHPELNSSLDYGEYKTVIYDHCNLQIGIGSSGDFCFNLPIEHEDYGKMIAAYYFWVFPNMMFNFYPWGLSVNIVKPINPKLTKVSFLTYIYDESKLDTGAGALLDKVERQDEAVVESVQRGVSSRLYKYGRYSPKMETGVHHFKTLIEKFMGELS